MERKFFVGGNWKMNGDKASIDGIIKTLAKGDLNSKTGLWILIITDELCHSHVKLLVPVDSKSI